MGGTPLEDFEHPDRAVYVLGSEAGGVLRTSTPPTLNLLLLLLRIFRASVRAVIPKVLGKSCSDLGSSACSHGPSCADNGLPSAVLRACAHHVTLPSQAGRTASFNVAVTVRPCKLK
jgi:hypothetical protein